MSGWRLDREACVDGDLVEDGVGMVMVSCRWKLVREEFVDGDLGKGGDRRAGDRW